MGKEEGVRYIERLFPDLRRKYVHKADDEETCQTVLCDLLKRWDTLEVTSDKEFTHHFHRFYGKAKWVERSRRARSLVGGRYWLTHAGGVPAKEEEHGKSNPYGTTTEYNPWNNDRVHAMEWIGYLPTPLYRKIFTLYYIEGYSHAEVGAMVGSYREQISLIIREGVQLLKAINQQQQEEGRNVTVAPTTHGRDM